MKFRSMCVMTCICMNSLGPFYCQNLFAVAKLHMSEKSHNLHVVNSFVMPVTFSLFPFRVAESKITSFPYLIRLRAELEEVERLWSQAASRPSLQLREFMTICSQGVMSSVYHTSVYLISGEGLCFISVTEMYKKTPLPFNPRLLFAISSRTVIIINDIFNHMQNKINFNRVQSKMTSFEPHKEISLLSVLKLKT